MKTLIILSLIFVTNSLKAESKNVVYKYKSYESFDLGSFEIKGNIVAPGDLTVKRKQRKNFSRSIVERPNFNKEVRNDINNLR